MELKSQFNLLELGPLGCLQRLHTLSLFKNADNRLIWLWTHAAQLHVLLLTLSRAWLMTSLTIRTNIMHASALVVSLVFIGIALYICFVHIYIYVCAVNSLLLSARRMHLAMCVCERASARGWASGFLSMFAWLSKPTGSLALCIAIALGLFSQRPRIIRVQSAGNRHQVHWLHWWRTSVTRARNR